ncbi:hypothetical protein VMCG_01608 [Cytospora schulzeri]|uniref:RING-type domain-containing protein n=1 Tax=Cytospora schulzeri TaxID=448051 RepID=A0A423X4D7_9PEZI|nr:hypothetical protein VMCG_01608 [Valsa malicola]
MSSSAAAAPAGASSLDLDELRDDLAIHQTILASIQEGAPDSNTPRQIAETKRDIARIQRDISKARGHTQAPKRTTNSNGTMNSWNQSDAYAGHGYYSNSGNHTPASMSTSGTSSTGPAKRKHLYGAQFDDEDSLGPRGKSRRTTPSPFTTPSVGGDVFGEDDDSIIDLTGDDSVIEQTLAQQKVAFAQLERIKEDERLARSLQQNMQNGGSSNSMPASPAPNGPNAFDRILGRPSQSSQGQSSQDQPTQVHPSQRLPSQGQEQSLPSVDETFGYGSSQTNRYPMPGTFDFDDDDLDGYDPFTSLPIRPYNSASAMGSSTTGAAVGRSSPMGLYPMITSGMDYAPNMPAADLARQAALARQQGYDPSGGYGTGYNLPGSTAANGFASYAGENSPMASLNNRPGMLSSGAYAPLQNWAFNNALNSNSASPAPGGYLGHIINQTNQIDWDNGLDAEGNPISDRLRNFAEDLYDDPRKTAEEIKDLLANIRPDEDIPEEDRVGTPEALRYPLYPHQQLALQWMMNTEKGKNKSGILADDMGLGKTISTLALMVNRPASDRLKTNLIVGPVSLIKQWETEIRKKIKPGSRLSLLLLHNTATKYKYEDLRNYDVVVTSYGKVGAEQKRYERWIEHHPGASAEQDVGLAKSCPLLHPKSKFYRVILDEAQCIKNVDTLQARGACNLKATHRWCLTGTPMMNGIHELYSLIKFLKIAPYHNKKEFTKTFGSLTPKSNRSRTAGEYTKSRAMDALRILLKAIMLRRMKTSTLDGKPLVILPPKTEEVSHVEFSDDERDFYKNLETRTSITFNKYLRAGTVGKNYSNILVLLLRLRQACCHPHLNLDVEYVGNSEISEQDMNALAKTLAPDVVVRLKAQNEEGFKCPICFDAVIDPTIVLPCGHNTCAECFTTLAERVSDNNLRAGNEASGGFRCPECRGPVDPKRVINLTAFKEAHMPEPAAVKEEDIETASEASDTEGDDDSSSDSETDSDDDDVDRKGNLKDFIVDDEEEEKAVKDDEDDDDKFVPPKSARKSKAKRKAKRDVKGKGKAKKEEVKPHQLKTLRTEAKKNKTEYKRYMKYLKKNWLTSAKVTECCRILQNIQESGDKTIVFSQFTFLLDLLEIPIKYELGIKYCRYDGGMSRAHRDAAALDFQDTTSRTKVMLVSLKAGNAGLNLTSANHVVIMDPFWNPYIEMQAVDRAHRIGQQKPVHVHRLLVKETVEDRITELQEEKRKFVDAALDEGESKSLGRLSTRDLQYLFNGARN